MRTGLHVRRQRELRDPRSGGVVRLGHEQPGQKARHLGALAYRVVLVHQVTSGVEREQGRAGRPGGDLRDAQLQERIRTIAGRIQRRDRGGQRRGGPRSSLEQVNEAKSGDEVRLRRALLGVLGDRAADQRPRLTEVAAGDLAIRELDQPVDDLGAPGGWRQQKVTAARCVALLAGESHVRDATVQVGRERLGRLGAQAVCGERRREREHLTRYEDPALEQRIGGAQAPPAVQTGQLRSLLERQRPLADRDRGRQRPRVRPDVVELAAHETADGERRQRRERTAGGAGDRLDSVSADPRREF